MKQYSDRTAVVTGAASGIGYGIAGECVSRKMKVVLADIDPVALEKAATTLDGEVGRCITLRTDVTSESDVRALAEQAILTLGRIDFLFINAGVNILGYTWEYDIWDWKWIIDVNLWGTIHCLTSFLPFMLSQDSEAFIVFTSSGGAFLPFQTSAPYNATKSAILALAETLYNELLISGSKIRLRVVCPGMVNTNIDRAETHRQQKYQNPEVDYASMNRQKRCVPRSALEAGASVNEVAQAVFASMEREEFYVFPQANLKSVIARKFDLILQQNMPLDLSRGP